MTNRLRLLLLPLLALLFACNDGPSGIGTDYLPDDFEFESITIPASDMEFTSGIASVSNASQEGGFALLVGHAPDGTTAHSLMAITEMSDRLEGIQASDILSARLKLREIGYHYGDTTLDNISFDVVVYDGVFASQAQWSPELVNGIESGALLGSYQGEFVDSVTRSVTLDPAATAEFLNTYAEKDPATENGVITRKTLALRGAPDGLLIGSYLGATFLGVGDSLLPRLVIELADTTVELDVGASNYIVDLPESFEFGPGDIAVSAGAPVRTHVAIPLDQIPEGAVIHQAELILYAIPSTESHGTFGEVDRVVAYLAGENPLGDEDRLATYPAGVGRIFIRGERESADSGGLENKFHFRGFGSTILQWLRHERGFGSASRSIPNNGLILALDRTEPTIESQTVDRIRFYGPQGPEAFRPRMIITYSTRSEAGN